MRNLINYGLFAGLMIVIYTIASYQDVVDIDSAQYAAIAMEMLHKGDFFFVTERFQDYLDKPPLLFWLSALSYQLFGINNFAYKLPSILFSGIGIYYTYALAKHLYSRQTGIIAALICASSLGFVWFNTDVKTDAILTSCIVIATSSLIFFVEKAPKTIYVVLAGISIGLGMLVKGPIALIAPIVILFSTFWSKKEWSNAFSYKLLLIIPIIGILLFPMCLGLYQQFDLHPEKLINGKTNVSGLRFYFWEQSFGRVTGENMYKNDSSFFYLFHSLLLLIFPYTIFLLTAVFNKIKAIYNKQKTEKYTVIGSLAILSFISFSSYKIPHYAMIVVPFLSIAIANQLIQFEGIKPSILYQISSDLVVILILIFVTLSFLIFKSQLGSLLIASMLFLLLVYLRINQKRFIEYNITGGIILGFVFVSHVFPNLTNFAFGHNFAEVAQNENINPNELYFYGTDSRAFEFYYKNRIPKITTLESLQEQIREKKSIWCIVVDFAFEDFHWKNITVDRKIEMDTYDINRITSKFLNPKTRAQVLRKVYLVKIRF